MLRAITPQREQVARCMSYALQHADATEEVCCPGTKSQLRCRSERALQVAEVLIQSLMIDMTPIPRKLARLYVISDILHNSSSSMPNAWKFRQAFEKALPPAFDHLNVIYRSFPGRMKAEGFRKQVGAVLTIWQTMLVFPQATIDDLAERLAANDEAPFDSHPEGEPLDGVDLDGEAVVEDAAPTPGFKSAFKPSAQPAVDQGGGQEMPLLAQSFSLR